MTILLTILSIAIAYVLGSIPTAFWAGKIFKGLDIREHGSKNMGATNAFRVLGKGPGILVLLIDIAKGAVPLVIAGQVFGIVSPLALVLIGVAAVAGHNYTMFLGFKGGKGVATSLGVLIGLAIEISGIRPVLAWTLGSWVVVFLASGYVSLASITAAIVLPIVMLVVAAPFSLVALAIILSVSLVVRHRVNISRLIQGKEGRFKLPYLK